MPALCVLAALAARAEEPSAPRDAGWWVGLPIADVQLVAPEGGLPEANLEPLLRAEDAAAAGRPLDAGLVQTDLATLFRVGEFSGVEAHVEPWTTFDEAGDPLDAVLLTYVVYPAPRIARIRVQGNREFGRRELLGALGLDRDTVFYPDLDDAFASDRARAWLRQRGYTGANVTIRTTEPEPGRLYVVADVEEGPPNTLERLVFAGDLDGVATDRELRRWARREGVVEGRPLAPDAVPRAQERIREELGSVKGGLFRERRGWIGARVTVAVVTIEDGARVTFAIEPGSRLALEVEGMGFRGRRRAEEALGVDHRLRLTRGWLDQAPDALVGRLQESGWYAATAEVTVERTDEVDVLRVAVDRGARHTLGVPPRDRLNRDFGFVKVAFDFPDDVPRSEQRQQATDLQVVLHQASPDVLRRHSYTEAEMRAGLEAARQFYVGRGHLDAALTLDEPSVGRRRSLPNALRRLVGQPARRRLTPHVTVDPGPVTRLGELAVSGQAPAIALPFVDEANRTVGGPFSPQALDALARRVAEAHRAEGWLEADVRVETAQIEALLLRATIQVDPGPLVLLRSAVTRGTRYTRQGVVQRELESHLELGAPIRAASLDDLRSHLYDLGVFSGVATQALGDEPARDLVVEVTERKRWLFETGGGVATDQGVRAFGRLLQRNVGGLAHQLELFGQVGFEWRSDDLRDWLPDFASPEWRAATSYTARRFPGHEEQLVLDLVLRERIQERTWRMDRTGGGVALETMVGRTRFRGGTRLESRKLDQVDPAALLAGEPWARLVGLDPASDGPGLVGDPVLPSAARWQESVTGLVAYEGIDAGDLLNPRRGVLLSANTEWAPGLSWPDQPRAAFVKGEARASGYAPVGEFTLHLSAMSGYAYALSDGVVPLEDRFRLGGTGSLRGFVRDGVGPQNVWPRVAVDWPDALEPALDYTLRDDPERWTPTGGDATAVGSIDLQMPLPALGLTGWEGYTAELFADVGNVWLLDPDAAAASTSPTESPRFADALPFLRVGAGAGLGVLTPVGPLRIDVALNPQAAFAPLRSDRRAILVGDWEEPPLRAHLTLGTLW